MDAVKAVTAGHQRRDHHLRADLKRLAHEILVELTAAFGDDAAELMAECERPGQRSWPVAFEDMQVGAADAAGADLYQRSLAGDLGPGNGADHRLRARAVIG